MKFSFLRALALIITISLLLYFINVIIPGKIPSDFYDLQLKDIVNLAAQAYIAFIAYQIQHKLIFTTKLVDSILNEIDYLLNQVTSLNLKVDLYNNRSDNKPFHDITKLLKEIRNKEEHFLKRMKCLNLNLFTDFDQKLQSEIFNIRHTLTGDNFGANNHLICESKANLTISQHKSSLEELKTRVFQESYK
ncbi:MAG: hypothetical protein N4A33_09380 [Bacteriovoracaceae bacterium]|jgi:hypothetical protein|nr:hypothetical protein [Bacteriovoracaceae bacterium]